MVDYFSWPYNTKIDVITKARVDFPAVTICNLNRVRRSKLLDTRYEGIVDVDGGFNVSGENSWFWDFNFNIDLGLPDGLPSDAGSFQNRPSSDLTGGSSVEGLPPNWSQEYFGDWHPFDSSIDYRRRKRRDTRSSSHSDGSSSSISSSLSSSDYYSASSWWTWDSSVFNNLYDFDDFDDFFDDFDDFFDVAGNQQYGWDVDGESDWDGFYKQSKADDFSDIAEIINPTREELEELGHQAEDLILQCTFDKKRCNYT